MLSLLELGILWVASVVDVHPRESIAGVHSTIRRQGRLFLSSVHEVSAVSAIFSAFESDNIQFMYELQHVWHQFPGNYYSIAQE